MAQTAIWIPPCLCGCQIQLTADFLDGDVINGVSYRHPKSGTITDCQLISVCDDHVAQSKTQQDHSVFFSESKPDISTLQGYLASKNPNIKPTLKQVRGYLTYPIDNPTPAHNLYTYFSTHGGQKHSLSCGCSAHQYVGEDGVPVYIDNHPLNTKKCDYHTDDTHDMQQAKIDHEEFLASQVAIDVTPVKVG